MANTITSQYFVTLFDEFKNVPIAKIEMFISIASIRVAPTVWGSVAPYATALLTAHMIATAGGSGGGAGGAGGALTSEAVGDLSRGFAKIGVAGSGDEELQTTQYGAQYVALRRETFITAGVTGPTTLPPDQGGYFY